MNLIKKLEMKKVIDATWGNPQGKELRDKLFPNGKPEPEEFIETMAKYIKDKNKALF